MRIIFFLLLASTVMLSGCGNEQTEECVFDPPDSNLEVTVEIEQFQDSLSSITSKEQLVSLLTREPGIRDYIFRRAEYPNDSVFVTTIYNRLTNPHIDTLLMETKRVFGDLSQLELEFEEAFKNVKYYYPDFKAPKIKTVISGLDTDLLVSDTLIIVGLDFYLGKGAKYRPKMYDYLLRKYDQNDIVPSCMLIYGIDNRLNKTNINDKTVLADMIAYGKSFHFAKHMLPCIPDSVLISYSPEEIQGSRENQDLIWARFIESQVLYSTSHVVKKDYLGERPITIQVGEKCPGRIGQWIGWQIVNKYRETHKDKTLRELMEFENAQQLFKESNYKPSKKR